MSTRSISWKLFGQLLLAATLASFAASVVADIDLNTPEGNLLASRKMQCSTVDGEPAYYWWKGKVFARRQGEKDRNLFNIEGMNVRSCKTINGGKRGRGYRLVSREILLYTDPGTGQPLDTWNNPWTGQTVDVLHVLNDPVNWPPNFARDENGKATARMSRFGGEVRGDTWWTSAPIPLYYHNVLAGDYQRQIGGVYHATEMFNFSGHLPTLVDESTETAAAHVGWVRLSDWLPWMMMEGREGIVYMHAAGNMVDGFEGLGPVIKTFITTRAPKYKMPPPLDDDRPNETSWTYYKKVVEGGKFPRGGH